VLAFVIAFDVQVQSYFLKCCVRYLKYIEFLALNSSLFIFG